ncbi:VanZ family protein [Metabacillus bambusae]|uniref:VanZ family protein n=1 Tax=Metabacillus bambusae TaxID=2795218 RepID=A0ABS3MYT1_9BACI|nr:VanZ family protein [Metabacillus bambusae]MBO1511055.1 VanZ family protein [Metabacillus bambusae]
MQNFNNFKIKILTTFLIAVIYMGWLLIPVVTYKNNLLMDLTTILVNGCLILGLIFWFNRKIHIHTLFDFLIYVGFILYLFILHHFVTYINITYFLVMEYLGIHTLPFNQINLIPFKTTLNTFFGPIFAPVMVIQILGNLFLLTPFAFALLTLKITNRKKTTVLKLFVVSIGIEIFQLLNSYIVSGFKWGESGRATDIDDVILNTLSALIGVGIFNLYCLITGKKPHQMYAMK